MEGRENSTAGFCLFGSELMIQNNRDHEQRSSKNAVFLLLCYNEKTKEKTMEPYKHLVQYYETDKMGNTHH